MDFENLKYLSLHIEKLRLKKYVDRVSSTNVKRIGWDSVSKDLTVQFDDNSIYTYYKVPEAIYFNILDGMAGTRTAGKHGPIGKFPSVGAAVHSYLIEGGYEYKKGGSF